MNMFSDAIIKMLIDGTIATLYMTFFSTFLSYVIGLPLGVLLVTSEKGGLAPLVVINKILNIVVNILRSVPFLILMIAVIPITKFITGTSLGPTATVVPLVIAAAPFVARLIESSIKEVDKGVIEAALSMGASPFQIIYKVMIPESMPSLILGAAIATTTILGYSAMAGVVGGGGLGDIAIRYGVHRYETAVMMVTVVLLVLIVQIIQVIGDRIAKKIDKR